MTNNNQQEKSQILSQVHEGMTVFGSDSQRIGTVSDLYSGAVADEQQQYGSGPETAADRDGGADGSDGLRNSPLIAVPLITGLAGTGGNTTGATAGGVLPAFAFDNEIPQQLRSRLLEQGFIQVKGAGLFGAARYITPDQIVSVDGQDIHLNVTRDALLKGV